MDGNDLHLSAWLKSMEDFHGILDFSLSRRSQIQMSCPVFPLNVLNDN